MPRRIEAAEIVGASDAAPRRVSAADIVAVAEPEPDGPTLTEHLVRTGLRVGGSILGAAGGALVGGPVGLVAGGAAGAGLGELGAEYLETQAGDRDRINPWQVGTQTALGAIPIARAKGLTLAQTALRQAGKGAALGGGASAATAIAEGEAPSVGGITTGAGLGAVLGGGFGAATYRRPMAAPVPQPRGFLRTGPGFVAGESGPAARFGDVIPMEPAPDGSFVRAVPGAYAQPDIRGRLPAGPSFVAGEAGPAAPFAHADDLARRTTGRPVSATDPSVVRSVPAAVLDREYQGRRLVPSQFAGDPAAVDAPLVSLTDAEARELRRMAAEMDALPFTKHTFNPVPRGRGNAFEIAPGAAGAEVYQDIIGRASSASRADVFRAITNLLAGKRTPTGDLALDVARRRLAGDETLSRPLLPPSAGDLPTPRGEDDFGTFAADIDDLIAGSRASGPQGASGISVREPGEEGQALTEVATRLALGGAGAAYGAASGDSPEDRMARAAVFGAAGAGAPSLIRAGQAGTQAVRRGFLRTPSRGAIPPAGEIPPSRVRTMPRLTDDVQDAADALLERYGGFTRQRRGVQSVGRTEAIADRVDVRTDRPLTPGTALNAERLRAYQNATATILKKQQQLEAVARAGRATPAQQLELEQVLTEAEVLTKSFRGAAAEAGRALHILRYQARILASGDQEAMRDAAQATAQGLDARARSYFYANILSGVATHERNILGNLSNAVFNLAAHPTTVAADVVRSRVTGQPRQVFLGELPAKVAGTVAALPRAFSHALQALRTGMPDAEITAFDRPIRREFAGGGKNPFNYPGRALDAADDFFASLAGQQTLYGAAFAHAKREGYTGGDFVRRVADLKANPSEAILEEVTAQRARLLFRERPGRVAQAVLAAKQHLPLLDYVLPFVRVPANILRQGFEASPAGFGMSAARQGGRPGADAMGRAAFGSLALAPLAYYAAAGKITGDAPADPATRAAFYESGKRPNSILIGDRWINYQVIQPLNVPLTVIANGFQTWRESQGDPEATADQLAQQMLGRTASSLLDQSFLSGLSALVDALGDPDRYAARFLQQVATGFVPFSGALRTTAHATDRTVRAPQGVAEGVQAILPGQSQSLPPRLTRFGEPVPRENPLNVFRPSPVVTDPVAQALEAAEVNLRPAQGPRTVSLPRGIELPLTTDQRTRVGQTSGRGIREILERVIATPAYQQASPAGKQYLLERAITEARGRVTSQLQREALLQLMAAPSP